MPRFPLGQADNDRVAWSDVSKSWVRRAESGSDQIEFSAQTVQLLEDLTTADGVAVGSLGIVLGSGNIYRALEVTALSSSWEPASGHWTARDFGAVGDNVTDDTVPLQDALDTINAHRTAFGAGGVLFLDPGDYRVTSSLVPGGETTILGAGELVSRIRTSVGIAVIAPTSGVVELALRHFGIEGNGPAVAGGIGVLLDNIDRYKVESLDIRSIETIFIARNGTVNGRIYGLLSTSCTDGIVIEDGSNDNQVFGCRVNAASVAAYKFDGVSQCNLFGCSAEGISGASAIGFHVAESAASTIACGAYGCRFEGNGTGTGVLIDAGVQYTAIENPYWTNVATPITDNGEDTAVQNRGRLRNPLIAANPFQGPGEALGRLSLNLGTPNVFELLSHDIVTAADGDPIILRRQLVEMDCGSNTAVSAATVHYMAWRGEAASASFAGARVQLRMPFEGRILSCGVVSNGNLGSTLLELFTNGAGPAVASDTQTVAAGAANGATYVLSTDTADVHWNAGDTITIGLTPTNAPASPVIMVAIVAEVYIR